MREELEQVLQEKTYSILDKFDNLSESDQVDLLVDNEIDIITENNIYTNYDIEFMLAEECSYMDYVDKDIQACQYLQEAKFTMPKDVQAALDAQKEAYVAKKSMIKSTVKSANSKYINRWQDKEDMKKSVSTYQAAETKAKLLKSAASANAKSTASANAKSTASANAKSTTDAIAASEIADNKAADDAADAMNAAETTADVDNSYIGQAKALLNKASVWLAPYKTLMVGLGIAFLLTASAVAIYKWMNTAKKRLAKIKNSSIPKLKIEIRKSSPERRKKLNLKMKNLVESAKKLQKQISSADKLAKDKAKHKK